MTKNLHRNILHNIFIFALLHEVQAILFNKSSTPLLPFAHTLQMLVLEQHSWLHYFYSSLNMISLKNSDYICFSTPASAAFSGEALVPWWLKDSEEHARPQPRFVDSSWDEKCTNSNSSLKFGDNRMYFQDYFLSRFLGMAHVAYEKITQEKDKQSKTLCFLGLWKTATALNQAKIWIVNLLPFKHAAFFLSTSFRLERAAGKM